MNIFLQPSRKTLTVIGSFAVVLATAAAFVGAPARSGRVVIDTDELGRIVENEEDHIDAVDLAGWILQKKNDLKIIDLRSKAEFDSVRVPTAIHHSLVGLDTAVTRDETIVLYSGGGVHSAQAWFLLKAHGFPRVYFLKGGYEEWESEVLFPRFSSRQLPDPEVQKRIRTAESFGGKAIITDGTSAASPKAASKTKPQVPHQEPERDPFRRVC